MKRILPVALSIAGSDSGGGAGIQADLKTFAAFRVHGAAAVTALTVQNTLGVHRVWEAPPDIVAAQIDAVVEDMGADAVKTGMLSSAEIVEAAADRIAAHGLARVVVDPVMTAKGGARILRQSALRALIDELLPLAHVVTPNLDEASKLTGLDVRDLTTMREAARALHGMGPAWVVVKGGHLEGAPLDLLFDGERFTELPGVRFDTPHTHGTGCTFAAALAACLARGLDPLDAALRAKDFTARAIQNSGPLGRGRGPVNPLGLDPLADLQNC